MSCSSLGEKWSILLLCLQKQDTLEIRDAKPSFSDSAVPGGGFIVELFNELESFRLPAR